MRWLRAIVAGTALAVMPSVATSQESGIAVGSDAPGADVETLDGKPINLDQYFGEGPVLLQFWATWCSNCKALEPKINAAVAKYAGKVKVVAVAVSVNQTVERIKAYRDRYQMKHDIVYDRKGWASDAYEVAATSYIVVVNAQRKIVYTGLGADQDIEAAIEKALSVKR
jgi:thiol-disulfide isomerase/thioredoxin